MVNNHWIVNAALVLLVITLGFALVVPMVLGVWGNPLKASATRSFVTGVETVAVRVGTGTWVGIQRATPALRRFGAGAFASGGTALIMAGRALWLLLIALLVIVRASILFFGSNFLAGVNVLRSRLYRREGWIRPVAQGLSLKRSTAREPTPSKPLASWRLAFAVLVCGTAFAVLIILTIRWVTAALGGIVS